MSKDMKVLISGLGILIGGIIAGVSGFCFVDVLKEGE